MEAKQPTTNMPTLATLAHNKHKPKKAEAQAILRKLYEDHPEHGQEIAQLYAYFMPQQPKNPKSPFQWVARAVDPKDDREYLQAVYASGEEIVGTDGHRLHAYPDPRPAGHYHHVTEEPVELRGTYPDYKRVIPKHEHWFELDSSGLPVNEHVTARDSTAVYDIPLPTDCATEETGCVRVNKRYLDDALGGTKNRVICWHGGPHDAIMLTHESGAYAVIMPMRQQ